MTKDDMQKRFTVMLDALKFVDRLMREDATTKGKADYSVVRHAIEVAEGWQPPSACELEAARAAWSSKMGDHA